VLKHIPYYWQCWKQMCCLTVLWKPWFFVFRIILYFCNIINLFTFTFDMFTAFWLNIIPEKKKNLTAQYPFYKSTSCNCPFLSCVYFDFFYSLYCSIFLQCILQGWNKLFMAHCKPNTNHRHYGHSWVSGPQCRLFLWAPLKSHSALIDINIQILTWIQQAHYLSP